MKADLQKPVVPAFSLKGLLVSRGMNFSRVSSTMVLSTTALPFSTVTRPSGMVLSKLPCQTRIEPSILMSPPDGFVILGFCRTTLQKAVLADMDAALGLGDVHDRITGLPNLLVPYARFVLTILPS